MVRYDTKLSRVVTYESGDDVQCSGKAAVSSILNELRTSTFMKRRKPCFSKYAEWIN